MFRSLISLTALVLVGLFASLTFSFAHLSPTHAYSPITDTIAQINDTTQQEQKGKELYQQGSYQEAIQVWEQIAQNYRNQENWLNLASILSNLALAYQQVGLSSQAQQAITESLSLVSSKNTSTNYLQIYGQILNNQGLLQFTTGNAQEAFNNWEKAENVYRKLQDNEGILRAQLNQTLALRTLGLYPRACEMMIKALELSGLNCQNLQLEVTQQTTKNITILQQKLDTLPPQLNSMQVLAWRRLANVLRANRRIKEANLVLNTILPRISSPEARSTILLSLGKTEQVKRNPSEALKYYQQAEKEALTISTKIQSQLAQLGIFIETQQWKSASDLVPLLETNLNLLPVNHNDLYVQINFIYNLTILKQAEKNYNLHINIPSWEQITHLAVQSIQKARNLGDKPAESYGLGTLGKIYEETKQWSTAQELTEQALLIAQSMNTPEITYRWQWQLGRILDAQKQQKLSITAYDQAINSLQLIKNDLVASSEELLFTFQEEVEPIYRQLVNLLLQPNEEGIISQENLTRAREVIELLRLAELDNFFQQSCLVTNEKQIDEIDTQAAVIYTIILPDRLALILSLPQQPLRYYASWVTSEELEKAISQFRYTLVIRSQRDFFSSAQQLYQWIIQPLEADLEASGVETLVFVPDNLLRNIPIGALYDAQHKQYLIQKKYNVAITSGLEFLNPVPLKNTKLLTLAAGLTVGSSGFYPLRFVEEELEKIHDYVPSKLLFNQEFTTKALNENLEEQPFSILHLATHGQFSSEFEKTFILTWNDRLNILQLERLLQQQTALGQSPIELLVLSACQTASGDKRAALGLAGMAVRSGARSTLATLWSVNDEGTAQFMEQFYEQLATKTLSKAEAFKQAQLTLLNNSRYQHPFYWAPYVLLGNWL